jgi:Protein of unknown function (DUF3187)
MLEMKRLARCSCCFALISLGSGCATFRHEKNPEAVVRGPLATRQQQPMALTLFAFRPRRAVTQANGELGVGVQAAWSSMEEIRRNPPWAPDESAVFDGETIRTTLRARYGLAEHTDVEVELPFLHASSGGLDTFLESWHSFFGLPGGAREQHPDDQYEMRVSDGADVLYDLEGNHFGVQDIPIILTRNVRDEDERGPAVALRGAIELPTGSESRGYGNGALDFGFGVLGERSWGRWTATGAFELLFPGQSDRISSLPHHELEDQFAIELGGEYRWSDTLSVVAGTVWTSRMISSMVLEEINREVFDLGFGLAWDVGEASRMSASLHEDLVAATGSDLTFQFGWTWRY